MKKRILAFLLLIVVLSLITVSAFAAAPAEEPTKAGIYGITGSGITPKTASGGAITADNSISGYSGFYADAVKFEVSASGLTAGKQYLLLVLSDDQVPGDDNIVYINQAAANAQGAVSFTGIDAAYPSSLVRGNNYHVYIVGEGKAFNAGVSQLAKFQYFQPYTPGDVDDNGTININDAMSVINHIVGKETLTGNGLLAADATADTSVNINDAMEIINYIVGKAEHLGK